jgi:hypothetical protein
MIHAIHKLNNFHQGQQTAKFTTKKHKAKEPEAPRVRHETLTVLLG